VALPTARKREASVAPHRAQVERHRQQLALEAGCESAVPHRGAGLRAADVAQLDRDGCFERQRQRDDRDRFDASLRAAVGLDQDAAPGCEVDDDGLARGRTFERVELIVVGGCEQERVGGLRLTRGVGAVEDRSSVRERRDRIRQVGAHMREPCTVRIGGQHRGERPSLRVERGPEFVRISRRRPRAAQRIEREQRLGRVIRRRRVARGRQRAEDPQARQRDRVERILGRGQQRFVRSRLHAEEAFGAIGLGPSPLRRVLAQRGMGLRAIGGPADRIERVDAQAQPRRSVGRVLFVLPRAVRAFEEQRRLPRSHAVAFELLGERVRVAGSRNGFESGDRERAMLAMPCGRVVVREDDVGAQAAIREDDALDDGFLAAPMRERLVRGLGEAEVLESEEVRVGADAAVRAQRLDFADGAEFAVELGADLVLSAFAAIGVHGAGA
jgi:hypothetical protein